MPAWDNHEVATGKYAGRPNNSELLVKRKSGSRQAGRGPASYFRAAVQRQKQQLLCVDFRPAVLKFNSTPGAVAQRQEHRLLYVSSSREQKKAAGGQYIAPSAKARLLPPRSGGNIDYYIKKPARGQHTAPSANASLLPPRRELNYYIKIAAGGQHTASTASGRILTRTSGAKRHIKPADSHPSGFDTTYRNPARGIKI
ncbi:hypothetical protein C8R43DRAFT_948729 [Mycena crocata]|nr:hypothetical protein C8R43DRAFT_948729 [Mycena crocata]